MNTSELEFVHDNYRDCFLEFNQTIMKNLNWCIVVIVLLLTKNTFSQSVDIKITDSYDGLALSGVKVEPICKDVTAYTTSNGKATLNLDVKDCCDVKITKIGYAPESVELCPGDNFLELSFYKSYNIKGVLKGTTGKALDRTRIVLNSECGDGQRVVYTDAVGRFKMSPPAIGNCCYELVVEHSEYPKNTIVFCTTDEVQTKDIRIEPLLSNTELFSTADVVYIPKTLAAVPVVTTTSSTPNYTGTPPAALATSAPKVVSPAPVYTPTPVYTPPPPASTPRVIYTEPTVAYEPPTPAPKTYTPEPVKPVSYTNKYIDPINMSMSDAMPLSSNFTYFDFNQAYIRPDAYGRLDNAAAFMQSHPDMVVEIGVHCDSRGDRTYNQVFSEQRARALADYLVGKGIGSNRLIVRGYGESQLLNHCADGVPCSPEEHRQNRRALFRIQGTIYDAGYSVTQSYQAYQPPAPVSPTPTATASPTINPAPTTATSTLPPGVPCPDCPVKELDNEEYMDVLHNEEYFDENFYDSDDQ